MALARPAPAGGQPYSRTLLVLRFVPFSRHSLEPAKSELVRSVGCAIAEATRASRWSSGPNGREGQRPRARIVARGSRANELALEYVAHGR
jgi:hypothetical protein